MLNTFSVLNKSVEGFKRTKTFIIIVPTLLLIHTYMHIHISIKYRYYMYVHIRRHYKCPRKQNERNTSYILKYRS